MTSFLLVFIVMGVLEFITTAYCIGTASIPKRTPVSVAINAVIMFALAMWAFWLLCNQ